MHIRGREGFDKLRPTPGRAGRDTARDGFDRLNQP